MKKIAGIILGIFGVAIVVGWDPIPVNVISSLSVGASLLAAISYALAVVYAKRTFVNIPPLTLAIGQQAAAAILLLPFAVFTLPKEVPSANVVFAVLGLAFLSTAVAYLLYFYLISSAGPTKAATVTLLVPLFGVLLGVALLNEPFGLVKLIGMGIVLSGVALVVEVRFRPNKR